MEENGGLLSLAMGIIQTLNSVSSPDDSSWLNVGLLTEPQRRDLCLPITSSAIVMERAQLTSKAPKKPTRMP